MEQCQWEWTCEARRTPDFKDMWALTVKGILGDKDF